MESFIKIFTNIFLFIHVSAGFTSIVLFWIPVLSKKGGKLHIKSGKWYVIAMWVVVITAAILSVKNIFIKAYGPAIFLGFLSLITSGPLWYAIRILKMKKEKTAAYKKKMFIFNLILVIYAIFMILIGLRNPSQNILMFIFGGLGLTSIPDVVRYLRGKSKNLTWIQEHLIGMITTGIAAYTAFFVFGGSRLFGDLFQGKLSIILWTAPGVLGTVANFYFSKKFGPKKA